MSEHPNRPRRGFKARLASAIGSATAKRLGLAEAAHPKLVCEADVPVLMTDGVRLFADLWYPVDLPHAPVILVRTPYGRGGLQGVMISALFARYGFRVVMQSCRGTDGSEGEFVPFAHEADDAQATVEWLRGQPWFGGQFATFGSSYLGYTQWALASTAPPELVGMVIQIPPINPATMFHQGGAFAYEVALSWTSMMPDMPSKLRLLLESGRRKRALLAAADDLPLNRGYVSANRNRQSPHFEGWLAHTDPNDAWWQPFDHKGVLDTIDTPILLQGGWLDLYAADVIEQFEILRARGVDVALTMAHSSHAGFARALPVSLPTAVDWIRAAFAGHRPARAGTVLAQVVGDGQWRRFDQWPPAPTPQRFYLAADGLLSEAEPGHTPPDGYRYDPANPTPSVGGELLSFRIDQDNSVLDARSDVLTYTTAPLTAPLHFAGPVSAELWCSSSAASADFFVRLCDVGPDGRSLTVCDGILRVAFGDDAESVQRIEVPLSPTLCTIKTGHRLQLFVASGAHPRFARNTGSGEPLATAQQLVVAEQTIFHDPDRPSSLVLQLCGAPDEISTPYATG